MVKENSINQLVKKVSQQKKIISELNSVSKILEKTTNPDEKILIKSHIASLKKQAKITGRKISETLKNINLVKPLPIQEKVILKEKEKILEPEKIAKKSFIKKLEKLKLSELEKKYLKRRGKEKEEGKKEEEKKIKKPDAYVKAANQFFFNYSKTLSTKPMFKTLKKDIVKANLQFVLSNYIAVILFTTLISVFVGMALFLFFLFFNFGATLPIITFANEDLLIRFLKVFWILFAVPITIFFIMFFYPSMEKKSIENRIDHELPFAVIHMSSISSSMIEPSKIFGIIILTKEYPYIGKEFTKIINEINVYGYDLISALRNSADNSPSQKLAALFNGLATTITSGGNLPEFFDKRAQTLLFDYRLEREKYTKSAETFMDIYISVVIAAPMILMLLLMMMKISGLGIAMSTTMISLMMVLGVSVINVIFLTFLHLKQPSE